MKSQPVLILTVLSALTGLAAALQLLATDYTVPGIIAAVAAGVIAALGYFTRNQVTPVADPKVEIDGELVPLAPVSTGWTAPGANVPVERPAPEGGHI